MRLFILIISIFISSSLSGQSIPEIQSILREKKFQPFKKYIDSADKRDNSIRWETLREIVGDNQEGVIKIELLKKVVSIGNVDNYTIKLLADSNTIFFYEIIKWNFKRIKDLEYLSYPVELSIYKDSILYQAFENNFREIYKQQIDKNDLFNTSIVYGSSCGLTGEPTEYQNKLDSLLLDKNIISIMSWLKSPNAEKQLYAFQGLRVMDKNGYDITPEQSRLMNIISKKKGMVNVCGGCLFSSDTIKNVVSDIESRNGYFSLSQRKNKSNRYIYWGILALILTAGGLIYYFIPRKK